MKRALLPAVLVPATVALALTGCSGVSTGATASSSSAPSSTATASTSTVLPSGTASSAANQKPVLPENNPPGDIPDNIAFVPYANAAGRYSFTHPEGWLEQVKGSGVLFTDKLNGVQVVPGTTTTPPTVASATADSVPALTRSQAAFELRNVSATAVSGGSGVLVVYRRNSAPDGVTGRQYRDEVQRYELVSNGHEVIVELFGPVGADNVDAYKTMITSLTLS